MPDTLDAPRSAWISPVRALGICCPEQLSQVAQSVKRSVGVAVATARGAAGEPREREPGEALEQLRYVAQLAKQARHELVAGSAVGAGCAGIDPATGTVRAFARGDKAQRREAAARAGGRDRIADRGAGSHDRDTRRRRPSRSAA